MTAPRYPSDEGPAAHLANGLQLLVIVRADLDAPEGRLREAQRLLAERPSMSEHHPPPTE